jgi:predicted transcriptional regulator
MVKNLNLSSGQCNKYLVDLKKTGYISEKSGIWETTEKGSQVIDACVICHNLMKLTQQDS